MNRAKYRLLLQKIKIFSLGVARHFIENDCGSRAEALTFSTVLSLVPLLTIFLGILTGFRGFSQFSLHIESFIFSHFLPGTGNTLQLYFHDFINKALKLSAISLIFLLIVAIKMIFSIEEAFDAIWAVKTKRPFISATLLYASTLILLPLLLGMSVALLNYIGAFSFFSYTENIVWLKKITLIIIPFIFIFGLFFFLYVVLPHAKVKLKWALCGASFATFLFEVVKNIFGWYIKNFTSYEFLYGALSLVPVFLLWLYCMWFIILLGATISHVLQRHFGTEAEAYLPQVE